MVWFTDAELEAVRGFQFWVHLEDADVVHVYLRSNAWRVMPPDVVRNAVLSQFGRSVNVTEDGMASDDLAEVTRLFDARFVKRSRVAVVRSVFLGLAQRVASGIARRTEADLEALKLREEVGPRSAHPQGGVKLAAIPGAGEETFTEEEEEVEYPVMFGSVAVRMVVERRFWKYMAPGSVVRAYLYSNVGVHIPIAIRDVALEMVLGGEYMEWFAGEYNRRGKAAWMKELRRQYETMHGGAPSKDQVFMEVLPEVLPKEFLERKYQYVVFRGIDPTVVEADSVGLVVDGVKYELHYRKSDGQISLSVLGGVLTLEPVASNVVRIRGVKP